MDVLRHTKFFYDLMMCHGFDPRSFRQFLCRCVMILTRDDFGKYEVAIRKRSEFVSGIHLSYGKTLEDPKSYKDC